MSWLVDTQVLDHGAGTAGASVLNDDAVLRGADLTDTLKLNLDGHDGLLHWSLGSSDIRTLAVRTGSALDLYAARDHRSTMVDFGVTQTTHPRIPYCP